MNLGSSIAQAEYIPRESRTPVKTYKISHLAQKGNEEQRIEALFPLFKRCIL
jgi:hypothetical protein